MSSRARRLPRLPVRAPRGVRCRYYVNTNFFVDLEEGVPGALGFARARRGLCTSSIILWEYREVGQAWLARRLAADHGIAIVRVPIIRAARAAREVAPRGSSWNTILDYAHILAALSTPRIDTFVTSDAQSCNRALRMGLYCINHRTGEERAPQG